MKFPTTKEIKQYKIKQEDKKQFINICNNWAIENPTQAKQIIKNKRIPPLINCPDGMPDNPDEKFIIEILDTPISRFSDWILNKYKDKKEAHLIIGKLLSGGFSE